MDFLNINYVPHNNWNVQREIYPVFKFLLSIYEKIFGSDVMKTEMFYVYIDRDCPTAPITVFPTNRIILKSIPNCLCALVFELAHELTHYAIKMKTGYSGDNEPISAFAEPACEAMALYILRVCSERWDSRVECRCDFFGHENKLSKNFENYRIRIYNDVSGQVQCARYEEWLKIDTAFTGKLISNSQRPNTSAMRNHLYDTFIQMPVLIQSFIEYPLFIRSLPYDKLVDSNYWMEQRPTSKDFIHAICSIQPQIA